MSSVSTGASARSRTVRLLLVTSWKSMLPPCRPPATCRSPGSVSRRAESRAVPKIAGILQPVPSVCNETMLRLLQCGQPDGFEERSAPLAHPAVATDSRRASPPRQAGRREYARHRRFFPLAERPSHRDTPSPHQPRPTLVESGARTRSANLQPNFGRMTIQPPPW